MFGGSEIASVCPEVASKLVRPELVRDISKSVLSKSRLHKLHTFKEKILGQKSV